MKFTRTGKLLVETTDAKGAETAAEITSISNVPATAKTYILQKTITSRFVIHSIDKRREIQAEYNSKIKELRHFTKKENTIVYLSKTVVVTIFGRNTQRDTKMFYRIKKPIL